MTSLEVDNLFAQTLSGGEDDDAPWNAIHALRRIGTREVFEYAAGWCKSNHALKRSRGASVLAQLGKTAEHPRNSFPEESFAVVANMVSPEEEPEALSSAIHALGHLDDMRGIPLILSQRLHPSADVRFAVACALGSYPNDPQAVPALLDLTNDTDEDVRDWAVFGLGNLGDSDSPEIRDALIARLNDSFEDAREEALVSLAKRKDERVLPVLTAELKAAQDDDSHMTTPVTEAAYLMLGMDYERKDWTAADYLTELQKRFSL